MEARDIFFTVGSVALILVSAFVIFFFYALYRLTRIARMGIALLHMTAADVRNSFSGIARGMGSVSLAGAVFKLIRLFIRR